MNEFDEILNRLDYRKVIFYLLYNGEVSPKPTNLTVGQRIEESMELCMQKLYATCPRFNDDNDELFGIISDFSDVQREVFMEIGFMAGFELFQQIAEERKRY